MADQQYCLRWNNHQQNFITIFKNLLDLEELVDVTISVEGKRIRAHKVVLSACSPFFKLLFSMTPSKHPIVILNEIKYKDMKTIIDYIYCGEVNVDDDHLADILEIAETLQISGLYDPQQNNQQLSENSIENANKKVKRKYESNAPVLDVVGQEDSGIVSNEPNAIEDDSALLQMDESDLVSEICTNNPLPHFEHGRKHFYMDHTTLSTQLSPSYISDPNVTPKRRRNSKVQDSENFLLALEAVRSGKLGFCKAAKLYGLNNRTLWLEYKKRGYPVMRPPVRKVTVK